MRSSSAAIWRAQSRASAARSRAFEIVRGQRVLLGLERLGRRTGEAQPFVQPADALDERRVIAPARGRFADAFGVAPQERQVQHLASALRAPAAGTFDG